MLRYSQDPAKTKFLQMKDCCACFKVLRFTVLQQEGESINIRVFLPSRWNTLSFTESINSKQPYPIIPFNTVEHTVRHSVRHIWQISLSNKNACIRTYDGFSRRFLHVSVLHMNPVLSNLLLDFLKITTIHSQFISQLKPWPNGVASSRNLNLRGD